MKALEAIEALMTCMTCTTKDKRLTNEVRNRSEAELGEAKFRGAEPKKEGDEES